MTRSMNEMSMTIKNTANRLKQKLHYTVMTQDAITNAEKEYGDFNDYNAAYQKAMSLKSPKVLVIIYDNWTDRREYIR